MICPSPYLFGIFLIKINQMIIIVVTSLAQDLIGSGVSVLVLNMETHFWLNVMRNIKMTVYRLDLISSQISDQDVNWVGL